MILPMFCYFGMFLLPGNDEVDTGSIAATQAIAACTELPSIEWNLNYSSSVGLLALSKIIN